MLNIKMDLYFKIKVNMYFDEPTKCWVYHNKKYDITGYGKTTKRADKMFRFSLNEFLKNPIRLKKN